MLCVSWSRCSMHTDWCRRGTQWWLKTWSSMKCSVMGLPTNWTSELRLTLGSSMTPFETIEAQLLGFNCRDSIPDREFTLKCVVGTGRPTEATWNFLWPVKLFKLLRFRLIRRSYCCRKCSCCTRWNCFTQDTIERKNLGHWRLWRRWRFGFAWLAVITNIGNLLKPFNFIVYHQN